MTRMRDKYLHTNCLAALANMSSQFQHLHPYVTQRIVSLFHLLARKHSKILDLLQQHSAREAASATLTELSPSVVEDAITNGYIQDLTILEDVMRTVLEIINSCLIHKLHQNTSLVYALLYNRDIFDNYRTHPNFQDVLKNIETVSEPRRSLSITTKGILRWPASSRRKSINWNVVRLITSKKWSKLGSNNSH